jgi:hypothetical protein
MTGLSSGSGEVTKRSAPSSPFASSWIACPTFALREPIETRAAIPRTTDTEYRARRRREARESRQAMRRMKRMPVALASRLDPFVRHDGPAAQA